MKVYHISLLALFITVFQNFSSAQNSGFMGKKNTLTFSATGAVKVLPFALDSYSRYYTKYDEGSDKFDEKINLLRWDVNASYRRLIKRNVAVGLMVNYSRYQSSSAATPSRLYTQGETDINSYDVRDVSSPRFNVIKFKPIITLAPSNSLLPMGVTHTLGIGPTIFLIDATQSHRYQLHNYDAPETNDQTFEIGNPPSGFSNTLWGIEFRYSTTINYPISKWMLIEFGYDFTFGAVFGNSSDRQQNKKLFDLDTVDGKNQERYYNNDYHSPILRESLMNILSLRLGVIFPF